jgi:phage baseplate assembly protein W
VKGTATGPFTVVAGSATLALKVNGVPVTLTLPAGKVFPTKRIADTFNRTAPLQGLQFKEVQNRLEIESTGIGPPASIQVIDSPLATLFGFPLKVFRGKTLVSGWTLIVDPTALYETPYRYIVFDRPLPFGPSGFAEVSYTTTAVNCRRCNGTGLEFDWRYTPKGGTGEVRDDALLLQELLKILLTEQGSNPFHPWYGTTLMERIGSKITNGQAIQSAITADVSEAFRRWQNIKRSQENVVGQFVSDDEFPFRLLGVTVTQDEVNPTIMYVRVQIQKRSGTVVDLNRGFRLPEGTATAGLFRQSINQFVRA